MSSFSLLAVLGSGSARLSCHHRLPLAAYQAGSIVVIWDFTRLDDARKFILLQPGQSCSHLFFSKDGHFLFGFWRCNGRPVLSIWHTENGVKAAEHSLSDLAGCSPIYVDFHRETQHLVILHGISAFSASVAVVDDSLSPRPITSAALAAESQLQAVRLLDDGRHFAVAEAEAVHFWSYAGRRGTFQQVLRVDLPKPLRSFEVEGRLAYLLPKEGKLQVVNFQGERVQVAQTPMQPRCFDVKGNTVCIGSEDGSLMLSRNPCPDHWKRWPCPAQLCYDGLPPKVIWVTLGANEDYACVCFDDATHGVIHLSSGQYVALRAGHVGGIRSISMAPLLRAPVSLASRVLDIDRILKTKALAFLSVGAERSGLNPSRGLGCIAWPKQGPPARGFLERFPNVPFRGYESLPVTGTTAPSIRASLTTAIFHPSASLGVDGSFTGAYALIAGAEDGSIHVLQAEATSDQVAWRTQRVRPREESFQPEVTQLPGEAKPVSCCHLDVSPCGNFVLASFSDGGVDMLDFPMLSRLARLQYSQPGLPEVRQKSVFAWRATVTQRAYDTNVYAVSRARHPWEAVLHEVYPLGDSFVKAEKAQFALAKVCQAAGGFFTDFCIHPSQLYFVAAAVLPSSDARSILLVYDLWSGDLLNSCEVFTSLLVAPRVPMHPTISMDCSGSYVFCASTPAPMGPLDLQCPGSPHNRSGFSDLLLEGTMKPPRDMDAFVDYTSVVCAVDFRSGEPCFQASINASCISLGSPWHDPCQLLVGARDGTISVWQPPESIAARIRSLLQESLEAYNEVDGQLRHSDPSSLSPLSQVEEAVSFFWATKLYSAMNWSSWGATSQDLQPLLPVTLPAAVPATATAAAPDVVIQARRSWMADGPHAAAHGACWTGMHSNLIVEPLEFPGVLGNLGTGPHEPEIDPVSGLEVYELPTPYPLEVAPKPPRELDPAVLLGPAPEFQEIFGTREDHFEDPLPSSKLLRPNVREQIPKELWDLKPWRRSVKQGPPVIKTDVVQSVIDDLDHFERHFPAAKAPESP